MSDIPPSDEDGAKRRDEEGARRRDEEDARRRAAYERKVSGSAAVLLISAFMGAVVLVADNITLSLPPLSLPDIETPFSALPTVLIYKPTVNPYRTDGLAEKTATGTVTDIVERKELWPDGTQHTSFYARTEYFMPEYAGDCYFHHYLGDAPRLEAGMKVTVSYQPDARDACGTSLIVE